MQMYKEDILNSKVSIFTYYDDSGRKYFKANVSFSESDILTISRNSIEDLLNDLPQVLLPAIQARVLTESAYIN
jgi:hypothetical protein